MIRIAACLFCALVLYVLPAVAQDGAQSGRMDRLNQALENSEPIIDVEGAEGSGAPDKASDNEEAKPSSGVMPARPPVDVLDEEGMEAARDAFQAYYEYQVAGFAHRSKVFRWQLLSSRMIFAMVIAIVLAGLYFSWTQFHAGLNKGENAAETSLEASIGSGIKVTSPVLGVIILALSLGFFYLYLVHVYPIEEIF